MCVCCTKQGRERVCDVQVPIIHVCLLWSMICDGCLSSGNGPADWTHPLLQLPRSRGALPLWCNSGGSRVPWPLHRVLTASPCGQAHPHTPAWSWLKQAGTGASVVFPSARFVYEKRRKLIPSLRISLMFHAHILQKEVRTLAQCCAARRTYIAHSISVCI